MLLISNPFFSAETAVERVDLELTLDLDTAPGTLTLLHDEIAVASATLDELDGPVVIHATEMFNDTLDINFDIAELVSNILMGITFTGIQFDGFGEDDDLNVAVPDQFWEITGPNAGNVGGVNMLSFTNTETILGGTDNTFVFSGDLTTDVLSGVVFAHSNSTVILANGQHTEARIIRNEGFDTVDVGGTPVAAAQFVGDNTFALNFDADDITVACGPSQDHVQISQGSDDSTIHLDTGTTLLNGTVYPTKTILKFPSDHLTVGTGAGDDSVDLNPLPNFVGGSVPILLFADDGNDRLTAESSESVRYSNGIMEFGIP